MSLVTNEVWGKTLHMGVDMADGFQDAMRYGIYGISAFYGRKIVRPTKMFAVGDKVTISGNQDPNNNGVFSIGRIEGAVMFFSPEIDKEPFQFDLPFRVLPKKFQRQEGPWYRRFAA